MSSPKSTPPNPAVTAPIQKMDKEKRKKIQEELMKFLLSELENLQKEKIVHTEGTTSRGTVGVTMVEFSQRRITDFAMVDDIIGGRFRVIGKLREGGYGQIYKAYDSLTMAEVALKIEVLEPGKTNKEAIVLTKFYDNKHCPKICGKGFIRRYVSFVAMQLLGKNLSELRKTCPLNPPRFSVGTAVRLIMQCLRAIEGLHAIGFVHRDIKPSNYAMGGYEEDQDVVYLFDFGLSMYYLNEDGSIKPPRSRAGFRGTVRYASINAHDAKELSRRDDLWSIFYSLYEFLTGKLPWKSHDKNVVGEAKRQNSPQSMCARLPQQCLEFVKLIDRLDFSDKPFYEDMDKCLQTICDAHHVKRDDFFDWQLDIGCGNLVHWSSN